MSRVSIVQSSNRLAIRVAVVGLIVAYLFYAARQDGTIAADESQALAWAIATLAFGLCLLALDRISGRQISYAARSRHDCRQCRNHVLPCADGEAGATIIGVYLFITFGNGFRYGRTYLHASQALSILGFGLVVALSDYWHTPHFTCLSGSFLRLLALPFYVGVLAQRIEEARKKANEANRAKGRFLANMSHEMRTPLNGVIAMADVLRETQLSRLST